METENMNKETSAEDMEEPQKARMPERDKRQREIFQDSLNNLTRLSLSKAAQKSEKQEEDSLMNEYKDLKAQMPKTVPLPDGFVGDEPPELTEEDEQLLSRAWQEVAEGNSSTD